MVKFALKHGTASDKETKAVVYAALMDRDNFSIAYFRRAEEVPEDYIPIGNIDWVQSVFGRNITPIYYPDFARRYLRRKVWFSEKWPLDKEVFIKPADKPKRFNAKKTVIGSFKGKKKGPFWCSEIIKFEDEWRIYVQNGKIVYCGWYYPENGVEKDLDSIYLNYLQDFVIPEDWCGCIDVGLINKELVLVECGEPYSVGWYGKISEGSIYANFLFEGYKWMLKNVDSEETIKYRYWSEKIADDLSDPTPSYDYFLENYYLDESTKEYLKRGSV